MKLSTKGRYAMVALADIAMQPEGGLVSLAEIARRQDISLPYLEQLFVKLRRVGLVDSARGPGGGYRLARPASEIRVVDILAAVDETVSAMHKGPGAQGGGNSGQVGLAATYTVGQIVSNQTQVINLIRVPTSQQVCLYRVQLRLVKINAAVASNYDRFI